MPGQLELLPRAGLVVKPEPVLSEPRFWVCRLVIWKKPGDMLREIPLRPGLNIVWSPDPADGGQAAASESALGHGSGKTLFCRLLRYVLGEDRFSSDDQRFLIGKAYPEGMVGAEVMLDGTQWAILRPLGHGRQHYAVADARLEALAEGGVAASGMAPFLNALEAQLITRDVVALIPVDHPMQAWRMALAWLSRDQECRFDKVLDWRSVDSDSDSPARGPSATRLLDTVRALVGAIDPEEYKLRAEIETLEDEQKEAAQESARQAWELDRLRARLIADLELDPTELLPGRLSVEPLRRAAKARLMRPATVSKDVDVSDLERLRTQAREAEHAVTEIKRKLASIDAAIPIIEKLIQRIRGQIPGASVEVDNRENPLCPVCAVPISRVLADKCTLSDKLPDPGVARQRLEALYQELEAEKARLVSNQATKEQLNAQLPPATQLAESLTRQVEDVERIRDERSDAWYSTRRLLDDANRLEEGLVALEVEQAAAEALNQKITDKRGQTSLLREAKAGVFDRLSHFFDALIREMVGPAAGGKVAIDGQGLKLTVQLGGNRSTAAIDSLKVIAFDLAVMCMSMEGGSHLPAFLIHDSPREADLGLSVYHRLFHLVRNLETAGGHPAFQYIVTTTTRPPDGLREKPWLCEVLGGAPAAKRLMRCDL